VPAFWEKLPETLKKRIEERAPTLKELIHRGLVLPVESPEQPGEIVAVVNWPLIRRLEISEVEGLRGIDLKPLTIIEEESLSEAGKRVIEHHDLYENPQKLRFLKRLGLIELEGTFEKRVKLLSRNIIELLAGLDLSSKDARKLIILLKRLEGMPPNHAEKLLEYEGGILDTLRNALLQTPPRSPLDDPYIKVLPPPRYSLKSGEVPPALKPFDRVFYIGKLLEEGELKLEDLLDALEKGPEHLAELVNRYISPSLKSKRGKEELHETLRFIVDVAGRVRDEHLEDHPALIADLTGSCPRCGGRLKYSGGARCARCGLRLELSEERNPKPVEVEEVPRSIERITYEIYRWPHHVPVIPVSYEGKPAVLVNPYHPLISALRRPRKGPS